MIPNLYVQKPTSGRLSIRADNLNVKLHVLLHNF